jgi:hypothetical protein
MDYSKIAPNTLGIPNKEDKSKKVQDGISKWKRQAQKRKCKDFSEMSYWQVVSNCPSL